MVGEDDLNNQLVKDTLFALFYGCLSVLDVTRKSSTPAAALV